MRSRRSAIGNVIRINTHSDLRGHAARNNLVMANFDPYWFGYGALLLLLAASFAARLDYIRLALAVAALLALPVAIFHWKSIGLAIVLVAILLANISLSARMWLRDSKIAFSPEEQELRRQHFDGLSAVAVRQLIDQGNWISARRGDVLIRENQAAPSLFYLAEGEAVIQRDGIEVGMVTGGALIGEATVLDAAQATGTVTLAGNARLWFVPAAALRAYLAANPEIAGALHEGFARALRGKLANANARIADRSPLL